MKPANERLDKTGDSKSYPAFILSVVLFSFHNLFHFISCFALLFCCHFNQSSNVKKLGIEYRIFVIFIQLLLSLEFWGTFKILKWSLILTRILRPSFSSHTYFGWKKNQNKHSKFNTKFMLQRPFEMTWSTH